MPTPLILGTNAITGSYDVDNSLRFNDGSSDYLNKTLGTATNRKKWTFSAWIKRTNPSSSGEAIISALSEDSTSWYSRLADNGDGRFDFTEYSGSAYTINLRPNVLQKDPTAWYHFVLMYDSAQSTASDRVKYYINGSQITSWSTEVYPSQNQESGINKNHLHTIGKSSESGSAYYFDGYMAEVVFCDGQAYSPTDFGEFDSDSPTIWKPKDVSGLTFGNNGFHLDFENSSSLGADVSGNSNDFTVNNLTSIDQTTDTCTNNFITLNPTPTNTNRTNAQGYSEGNTISIPNSHDSYMTAVSTIGLKGSGKWYWEAQVVWNGTSSNAYYPRTLGFVTEDYAYSASYLDQDDESWAIIYQASGGPGWRFGHNNSESNISGATTMANGDTMMMALDLDNGKFYAGRNGTFFTSGDPTSGSTGTGALATLSAADLAKFIFPAVTNASNATYYKFNFGNPAYSITSGNSDANGHGNFEYAVPSGYFSICTKNIAEHG